MSWQPPSERSTVFVLKKCLPYLVEKKAQAALAIELLVSKTPLSQRHIKGKVGSIGEHPHIIARQKEIFEEIKMLKRNPAAATTERVESERICDSLICNDGKVAELAEITNRHLN